MVSVQERIKVVKSESRRLGDYLVALPSDAWTQRSACDLWEARDVVGHLVWVARITPETRAAPPPTAASSRSVKRSRSQPSSIETCRAISPSKPGTEQDSPDSGTMLKASWRPNVATGSSTQLSNPRVC